MTDPRKLWFLWFGLLILITDSIQATEKIKLNYQFSPQIGTITLQWQEEQREFISSQKKRNELMIRFKKELRLTIPPEIFTNGKNWIRDLVVGYDSMFVEAQRNVKVDISKIQNGILIKMIYSTKKGKSQKSTRALDLVRARLLMKKKKPEQAAKVLQKLARDASDDVSVLISIADNQAQQRYWKKAFTTLEKAEKVAPENSGVVKMKQSILNQRRSNLSAEMSLKKSRDNRQQNYQRITGTYHISPFSKLRLGYAGYGETGGEYSPSAGIRDGELEERGNQIQLGFGHEPENGIKTDLTTWHTPTLSPGFDLKTTLPGAGRVNSMKIEYHRPNWNYFETTLDDGTRERLLYTNEGLLNDSLFLSGSGMFSSYHLNKEAETVNTIQIRSALSWFPKKTWVLYWGVEIEEPTESDQGSESSRFIYKRRAQNLIFLLRHEVVPERIKLEGSIGHTWDFWRKNYSELALRLDYNVGQNFRSWFKLYQQYDTEGKEITHEYTANVGWWF